MIPFRLTACILCMALAGAAARAAEPLVSEAFINAPVAEVWRIFTTSQGYLKTGVAHADVRLALGGEIRSHDDPEGRLGDPGTIIQEILAYDPERMLAMRVKQADGVPHADALAGAWTIIYFNPAGEGVTQVRIVGLGYGDDAASQQLRAYLAKGDQRRLDHIAKQYWPKCGLCKAE